MVTRNGVQSAIAVTELTVGDMVLLSAGDSVPADCVAYFCEDQFRLDESSVTGVLLQEEQGSFKKSINKSNVMVLSHETIIYAESTILRGNA